MVLECAHNKSQDQSVSSTIKLKHALVNIQNFKSVFRAKRKSRRREHLQMDVSAMRFHIDFARLTAKFYNESVLFLYAPGMKLFNSLSNDIQLMPT